MEKDKNTKPLPKILVKKLYSFLTRFVAFAETYIDYFDYLADKYTEDDLHIKAIDLQDFISVNTILEILRIHEQELKSGESDKTRYPSEMYSQLAQWVIESTELQIFAKQKNIDSNKQVIKSNKDYIKKTAQEIGKYADTAEFKRIVAKMEDDLLEFEHHNMILLLEISQLKFLLRK